MVFNAIFNNISVILWRSVLLVEETVVADPNKHNHILYYCKHMKLYIEVMCLCMWVEGWSVLELDHIRTE